MYKYILALIAALLMLINVSVPASASESEMNEYDKKLVEISLTDYDKAVEYYKKDMTFAGMGAAYFISEDDLEKFNKNHTLVINKKYAGNETQEKIRLYLYTSDGKKILIQISDSSVYYIEEIFEQNNLNESTDIVFGIFHYEDWAFDSVSYELKPSLPEYTTVFVPVKLSEPSDFSNNLVDCINIDGKLYHISLEYMEKYSGWKDIEKDIITIMGSDKLTINSYEELRKIEPFGICVDENGRNPSQLYRISDDIVVLEDYHCKYDKNGNMYHKTTKDELIGYRICTRLSSEVLYKNCWYESGRFKYYIGSNSLPITKNKTINGIRYVFNKYGQCQGKYTGWTKSANGRCYYKNGIMVKNKWIKTKSGKKYYAGEDGYMRTGWARVDGKTCFFDEKGVWDGKKYYKGYKPVSMKYFLMDFDFSDDIEYEYCINYKKYYDFEGIDVVREILETEKDKKFVYDNSSDDETELNEEIYHGGKQIIIRCATDTKAADKTPHIIFTKDKDGNSYFYCSQYGFGCKLSDSEAYDKIAELI